MSNCIYRSAADDVTEIHVHVHVCVLVHLLGNVNLPVHMLCDFSKCTCTGCSCMDLKVLALYLYAFIII